MRFEGGSRGEERGASAGKKGRGRTSCLRLRGDKAEQTLLYHRPDIGRSLVAWPVPTYRTNAASARGAAGSMADGETWTGLSKAGGRATNHGHQSPGLLETCCESAAATRDVL